MGICGACIGNGLISGPVGVIAGVTLGSDASFDKRISGVVGAAVGVTLGSDASFYMGGMFFGNCGGWRMVTILMNAFAVVSPYVRDGIGDFGDFNVIMMSDAAWRKNVSLLTCVNGTCYGKNLMLSASHLVPVLGIKHLKHR